MFGPSKICKCLDHTLKPQILKKVCHFLLTNRCVYFLGGIFIPRFLISIPTFDIPIPPFPFPHSSISPFPKFITNILHSHLLIIPIPPSPLLYYHSPMSFPPSHMINSTIPHLHSSVFITPSYFPICSSLIPHLHSPSPFAISPILIFQFIFPHSHSPALISHPYSPFLIPPIPIPSSHPHLSANPLNSFA